jgi:hypothetical protein
MARRRRRVPGIVERAGFDGRFAHRGQRRLPAAA